MLRTCYSFVPRHLCLYCVRPTQTLASSVTLYLTLSPLRCPPAPPPLLTTTVVSVSLFLFCFDSHTGLRSFRLCLFHLTDFT